MNKFPQQLLALGFTIVFIVMMVFITFEAPKLLHTVLIEFFPDVGLNQQEPALEITAYLRPFGYFCFFLTILLIGLSYFNKSLKIAWFGTLAVYIPIFGHFALEMFYFAGIGILRILWLPLFDFSLELFKLGAIVLLPYNFLESLLHPFLIIFFESYEIPLLIQTLIIGLGLVIMFISTLNWFYGRIQEKSLGTFGLYRYSRHPQYLGFLIWSYGVLLLVPDFHAEGGYVPLPTLQWLIFALLVIRNALTEEHLLLKIHPEEYQQFRKTVPFLIPFTSLISQILLRIPRVFLKKDYPETQFEIILFLGFYFAILVLLSLIGL